MKSSIKLSVNLQWNNTDEFINRANEVLCLAKKLEEEIQKLNEYKPNFEVSIAGCKDYGKEDA